MRSRAGTVVLLLPLALALVAEASWIAVLAGLLETFALHAPVTGIPELLLAAVAGVLAARSLGPRLGARWSSVAVVLAAVAGAIGWLASPEVRGLLRADGVDALGPALAANPGGWLAALAFVRGMAHARLPVDPERIGTMLGVGVPGLAAASLVGGMIAEPWHSAFRDAAQVQVLVFLVTGIGALALARMANVAGTRLDTRRNPAWLVLLGVLVLGGAALALLVGSASGSTIATVAASLLVPLMAVGFIAGFDRRSLRILGLSFLAAGVFGFLVSILSATPLPPTTGQAAPPGSEGSADAGVGLAIAVLVAIVFAAIAIVALVAGLWLRRPGLPELEDDELRVIDRGGERDVERRPRNRRGGRRRPAPRDAVAAYLALVDALAGREPVARAPGETPSEHARRLRAAGHGMLALDLLAADVGLARFGGLTLGPAEDRRAVARAALARRTLLAVRVEEPEQAGATATAGAGPVTRGGRRAAGPGADIVGDEATGTFDAVLNRIRRGF